MLVPLVCVSGNTSSLMVKAEVGLPRDLTLTLSSSISWLGDLGKVMSYSKYLFPHL